MDSDGTDVTEIDEVETSDRGWLAEQSDLLTLEEGFDRAMLSGPYICIEGGTRTKNLDR